MFDPFSPIAITAGVLANIATAIAKHSAQNLEGTLVGRMLMKAGLIEPNFNERLSNTLSRSLKLYFETYPQYRLSGIESFFRDPIIAEQVGNYILDRRPIIQSEIQQVFDQHLRSDAVTRVLLQQRGLDASRIIPDFLECYRRTLSEQLDEPQDAILLALLDQTDIVVLEMRDSEERLKAIIEQGILTLDVQNKKLEELDESLQTIKYHLGIDRPQATIVEEIQTTLDSARYGAMFDPGGICNGYPLQPLPTRYFVAQEFRLDRNDLRKALSAALKNFAVLPIFADDFLWTGPILCKISALIQSTPFGIYQLTTSQNRNVYLELGIAIGLHRPFILIKDKDAEVSLLAQGLDYYPIDSYIELRYELGPLAKPFLASIGSYQAHALADAKSQRTVVIVHGDFDVIDFCIPVARIIASHNLTPVILGDPTGKLERYLKLEGIPHHIIGSMGRRRLDETVEAIQTSYLGIYRIEKINAPDAFFTLGISMGLNRPGMLVHNISADLPSDLKGLSALKFSSYDELERTFPDQFDYKLRQHS
jgi:hypothetical protein